MKTYQSQPGVVTVFVFRVHARERFPHRVVISQPSCDNFLLINHRRVAREREHDLPGDSMVCQEILMRIPLWCALCACFAIGSLGILSPLTAQEPAEPRFAEAGLEQLAWLVGNWGEEDGGTQISASCGWTKNGSFLTRSFSVRRDEEIVLEGTQVIGWNAAEQRIQSWTFDSEGGFGQGYWSRDGDRWTVKTHFVLSTGERASSLNVFTKIDEDTLSWQSVNRERGGEILPNVDPITIVRLPAAELEESEPAKAEPEN